MTVVLRGITYPSCNRRIYGRLRIRAIAGATNAFFASEMSRKQAEAQPPSRAATVLIVDDVEDNREMYAEYLRFVGFQVDTAANGEDGLAKALSEPPDVVVLDLTMPRMDGWAFAKAVRADARTQHTRIIVLS